MTCIVGLVDSGKVYIGGDSAGISGWDLIVRADSKIFRNGSMLFGFTSSFRMGQLLRFAFKGPWHDPGKSVDEYMATAFVDAVRQCLKDGGYARKNNEEESGGTFLVGYQGQLFRVDSDYQVGRSVDEFMAIGCGQNVALGSMFSSREQLPRERVVKALEAAEHFNAGVRRPFVVEEL